jgi:hypothetical protein
MRRAALALVLSFAALAAATHAQEDGGAGVVVTFADGSSLPLTSWSLSYEYQSGAASTLAAPARRNSRELLVGKKALPTAGGVLEVQYREYQRMSGGEPPQKETYAIATGVVFKIGDKKSTFRIEAPHRDLLVPSGAERGAIQARALDLTGLTLTGTKRSFCILAYTAQVECNPPRGDRIVRIEFQR